MNVIEIMENFPDENSCAQFLIDKRWGNDVCCIHCGSVAIVRRNKVDLLKGWNCKDCGSTFTVKSQTIFHGSRIPLRKWVMGISIVSNAKKGVSSYQLARELNMNQKSAWYMEMRIRKAMKDNDCLLQGILEADETYVGGKPRKGRDKGGKRGRGTKKTPVIGVIERGGRVRAKAVFNLKGYKLKKFILENSIPNRSILMTDEYQSYKELDGSISRYVCNHKARFVNEDGITHTNTIESFWAGIKRAYKGTHHHYTKKWIQRYIDEAVFRWNHRNDDIFDSFFDVCFQN